MSISEWQVGWGLGFLPSSFMLSHLETERKLADLLLTGDMLKVTARYQVLLNCTKGLAGTVQSPAVGLLQLEFQGKRINGTLLRI